MTNLENYLGNLEKQEVVKDKRVKVVGKSSVNLLFEHYKKWLNSTPQSFDFAKKAVEKLKYSTKDVTNLSIKIKEIEDHKSFIWSGIFLSALIYSSRERDFEVITEHLRKYISWIGYGNTKNIIIKGYGGDWVGFGMDAGKITVQGSAGDSTGRKLEGGEVIINDSANNWTGEKMSGGILRVNGNAGLITGHEAEGGKIYVTGKIQGIAVSCKAEVYQNNKLVWPK